MMSLEQFQALTNHLTGAMGAQQHQRAKQASKGNIGARDMRVQDFARDSRLRGAIGPLGSGYR